MDISKELSALRARAAKANTDIDFARIAFVAKQLGIQEALLLLRNRIPGLTAVSLEREFESTDNGGYYSWVEAYTLHRADGEPIYLSNSHRDMTGGLTSFSLDDPDAAPILTALNLSPVDDDLCDEDLATLEYMWSRLTDIAMLDNGGSSSETFELVLSELYCIQAFSEAADDEASAFWSNQDGWGAEASATLYSYSDTLWMDLPLAAKSDAQWVQWPNRST